VAQTQTWYVPLTCDHPKEKENQTLWTLNLNPLLFALQISLVVVVFCCFLLLFFLDTEAFDLQLEEGVSASTEELVSAVLQAINSAEG